MGRQHLELSPNPGVGTLYGVTAIAANDAWAVGSAIYHWDGSSWLRPEPHTGTLYGVAAVAAGDVWAVGSALGGGIEQTRTLHLTGGQWYIIASPNVVMPITCTEWPLRLAVRCGGGDDRFRRPPPHAGHGWYGSNWT